jgi:hypothetical protein
VQAHQGHHQAQQAQHQTNRHHVSRPAHTVLNKHWRYNQLTCTVLEPQKPYLDVSNSNICLRVYSAGLFFCTPPGTQKLL